MVLLMQASPDQFILDQRCVVMTHCKRSDPNMRAVNWKSDSDLGPRGFLVQLYLGCMSTVRVSITKGQLTTLDRCRELYLDSS